MKNMILKEAAKKIAGAHNMLAVESVISDTAKQVTGNWNLAIVQIELRKAGKIEDFAGIKDSRIANYNRRKNQIANILIQFAPPRMANVKMYHQLIERISK